MKTRVFIGLVVGLFLGGIALWVSLVPVPEHDPRDLLYWSQSCGTNDCSAAAARGDARAQFFFGFSLIRTNLQIMIGRVPQLSSIPVVGKRFFQTVSYSLDNGVSQAQLAEAYRWIKQSADQGFAPAQEAAKLFVGKIVAPNQGDGSNRPAPIGPGTNTNPPPAGGGG